MDKTSRKEHTWKRRGARNARKTRTRLELGPRVAAIFTTELVVFFVEMIVQEYFGGPVLKKASITQTQKYMFRTYEMEPYYGGHNLDSSIVVMIKQCGNGRILLAQSFSAFQNRLLRECFTN